MTRRATLKKSRSKTECSACGEAFSNGARYCGACGARLPRDTEGMSLELIGKHADAGDEGSMLHLLALAAARRVNHDDYDTWTSLAFALRD